LFACCHFYSRSHLLLIIITATCISLSLRRTSAPIHLTSVLGVLGTQDTFCIVIAGLLERDSFDLFLPEFDKPWVIHLRETCYCSTNLCTWSPNTVYKNRSVCRHHPRGYSRMFLGIVSKTDNIVGANLLSTSLSFFIRRSSYSIFVEYTHLSSFIFGLVTSL
jgi:hypothetical protein